MKIAWFTPLHIKSAIGFVGKEICEELSKHCDIDIWTACENPLIKTDVNILRFDPANIDEKKLGQYDHLVFNMGNFAGYHKAVWEVMKKHKGIVILHDQTMHGFFRQALMEPQYCGNREKGYSQYLNLIGEYYGKQGVLAAEAVLKDDSKISDTELYGLLPLLQPVLQNARAVFTHAGFFAGRIKDYFCGHVGYSYLPIELPEETDAQLPAELNKDDGRLLIVSSGIVHPVKRIDKVAKILLDHPELARKVRYAVIGECGGEYGESLKKLANGALKDVLYLLGFQPDVVMKACLAKADICINLRYPNSEVCSYSLLEQMAYGKPVIVIDSGFYGEIPNDTVLKINIENEERELLDAFKRLAQDAILRETIGARAKEFIREQCTKSLYAQRIMELMEESAALENVQAIIEDTLALTNSKLLYLGFNQDNLPWTIASIVRQAAHVLLAEDSPKLEAQNRVLGIWAGFAYQIPGLNREGIMRFLGYMVQAMLKNHPVECEVWTYSVNEDVVRLTFQDILKDDALSCKIKIVTEKNWVQALKVPAAEAALPWDINMGKDNLCEIARLYSKAECFVPAIVYLDNVIGSEKPVFVPVHDMAVHQHYETFTRNDPLYKARFRDISSRAEHFARSGAFMFCNCETVRQEQLLKYIRNIPEKRTAIVYLPANIPEDIEKKLLSEEHIRRKFGLKNDYLFYATQIRPYKNVSLIIKALKPLTEKFAGLNLVLTGNPADVPEVEKLIKENGLESSVICVSNISEGELYSLYKYAAAVPVPTLFEGGFPWQACEALYMDVPLLLSKIPIVEERIKSMGFDTNHCGLALFDPYDSKDFAEKLGEILEDRQKAIEMQRLFRNKLLDYTWDDAAKLYYSLFFEGNAV